MKLVAFVVALALAPHAKAAMSCKDFLTMPDTGRMTFVRGLHDGSAATLGIQNVFAARLAAMAGPDEEKDGIQEIGFLDWVSGSLAIDAAAISKICGDVLSSKPSSNGYDIHCTAPIPFIAEVKCNVPINGGTKYGSAQKAGILKDIDALIQGKPKASLINQDSLKFMVFLDLPEVRAANEHLMTSNSKMSKAFQVLKRHEVPNDPAVVYGVYAELGA